MPFRMCWDEGNIFQTLPSLSSRMPKMAKFLLKMVQVLISNGSSLAALMSVSQYRLYLPRWLFSCGIVLKHWKPTISAPSFQSGRRSIIRANNSVTADTTQNVKIDAIHVQRNPSYIAVWSIFCLHAENEMRLGDPRALTHWMNANSDRSLLVITQLKKVRLVWCPGELVDGSKSRLFWLMISHND